MLYVIAGFLATDTLPYQVWLSDYQSVADNWIDEDERPRDLMAQHCSFKLRLYAKTKRQYPGICLQLLLQATTDTKLHWILDSSVVGLHSQGLLATTQLHSPLTWFDTSRQNDSGDSNPEPGRLRLQWSTCPAPGSAASWTAGGGGLAYAVGVKCRTPVSNK